MPYADPVKRRECTRLSVNRWYQRNKSIPCKMILDWRKRNPDKAALIRRAAMLKFSYGITNDQYDAILQEQRGACAVCGRPSSDFTKKLAVDHDHNTGRIRGLLCYICNRTVIGRHRDSKLLIAAARYLDHPPAQKILPDHIVPKRKRKRKGYNGRNSKIHSKKRIRSD